MSAQHPRVGFAPVAVSDTGESSAARSALGGGDLTTVVKDLFVECELRLGLYLVQLVGDRELAADLLQDTFHDALTTRGQLLSADNREAWLFGMARNRALRSFRRRQRLDRALRRVGSRAEVSDDSETIAVFDLLRRTLSPDDRALVLLRYLHGFETSELAEATGLAPDAIRQRLWRARARLRAAAGPSDTDIEVDG
jgi:RNA polymerase sigma-70 factor, ECF subfamily